jgi:Ca-activated chloride channel family protein
MKQEKWVDRGAGHARDRAGAIGADMLAFFLACTTPAPSDPTTGPGATTADGPPLTLRVDYSSEKKTWMEAAVQAFEATDPHTKSGRRIAVEATAMGSGEAVAAIVSGERKPHVFSPASGAYVSLLDEQWLSQPGHTAQIAPTGDALVLSPVVIAMWKPMAEALGWPKKALGWKDLLAIHADKNGWGTYGHPEWGRFKLGHTHPGLSNSGLLAVLAEAYAGAGKTRGLTSADLDAAPTRQFLTDVESSLVHYGKSTGFFADKMLERGPGYISAAVLYENLVVESRGKPSDLPLVAIYPVEGTFWSDHPWSVLDAEWVGPEEREAAGALATFLKSKPEQEAAMALGFRPADPSIPMGAPLDEAHGVDPKQPQTLLEVPDAATLTHLVAVWEETKRASEVTLVFDKSGSMRGDPLAQAKQGAHAFVEGLGPRDRLSVAFFDNNVYPGTPVQSLDDAGRAALGARIDDAIASGGTALYDAVAAAWEGSVTRDDADPTPIRAVVVMTDGRDESSHLGLPDLLGRLGGERGADVKVFTIAYGSDAAPEVLAQIAEAGRGSTAKGDTATIAAVFRDMAAFF